VSAKFSKEYDNTNIIDSCAFDIRIVDIEMVKSIVSAWLDAEFAGGRHQQRIDSIE